MYYGQLTAGIEVLDFQPTLKQRARRIAQDLYANVRAENRQLVPWRNASNAVKREFIREAEQTLGLV